MERDSVADTRTDDIVCIADGVSGLSQGRWLMQGRVSYGHRNIRLFHYSLEWCQEIPGIFLEIIKKPSETFLGLGVNLLKLVMGLLNCSRSSGICKFTNSLKFICYQPPITPCVASEIIHRWAQSSGENLESSTVRVGRDALPSGFSCHCQQLSFSWSVQ